MLQIGEFSKVCQVSVKTLHHYDKIGLLVPAEVDRLTGYRYYQVEQIDTMNYIQRLKRYEFSLEEIQQILAFSDKKEISEILRRQKEKLSRRQQEQYIQTAGREPLTHTKKGITLTMYICKMANLN